EDRVVSLAKSLRINRRYSECPECRQVPANRILLCTVAVGSHSGLRCCNTMLGVGVVPSTNGEPRCLSLHRGFPFFLGHLQPALRRVPPSTEPEAARA